MCIDESKTLAAAPGGAVVSEDGNVMRTINIGVAWYAREDYPRIREIMEDSHTLPPTYDEWERGIELLVAREAAPNRIIHKIYIDPETFSMWCKERNAKLNGNARAEFAALAVQSIEPRALEAGLGLISQAKP